MFATIGTITCGFAAAVLAAICIHHAVSPTITTVVPALSPTINAIIRAFSFFLTALSTMETLASRALAALQAHNSKSIDTKLQYLTELKQEIKHRQCPEAAIPAIFHVTRISVGTPHLIDAGFSILSHLTKRLILQDQPDTYHEHFTKLLPVLSERLGDQKERHRQRATAALIDAHTVSGAAQKDVQQFVCGTLLGGKNPRMKESAMHFIVTMHQEYGMLFKMFVPGLVDCCEDADGSVRMTAQTTIVTLFMNAKISARNDLEKRLEKRGVRKTIVSRILSDLADDDADVSNDVAVTSVEHLPEPSQVRLAPPQQEIIATTIARDPPPYIQAKEVSSKPQTIATGIASDLPAPSQVRQAPPNQLKPASNTASDLLSETPPMSVSEQEAVQLEPLYIETSRDLEDIFRDMHPCFEGKEAESNWLQREKSIMKLRRITKGNAPHDYTILFLTSIKTLLDGILKTVNSLRTTVCTIGCHLVQDLARVCGSGLDNMVEVLLQNLIKLCGNTKKISAAKANDTVSAIIATVSYHVRLLQHIYYATQDKNAQPRTYACGWLKTILIKHGHIKNSIDHSGGLDLIEKSIVTGLNDGNPSVRESMRPVYWTFAKLWSDKSETIMSSLSQTHQDMLVKNSANPNPPPKTTSTVGPRGKTALSQSTGAVSSRPSIKETIAAQKKAKAAGKDLPERPGSAELFASPKKTMAPARPATAMSTAPRQVSSLSVGTLSSAPVRPRRRADNARPTTADAPERKPSLKQQTAKSSPATSPAKPKRKRSVSFVAPVKVSSKEVDSPATITPEANSARRLNFANISPTKSAENLTMVIPSLNQSVASLGLDKEDFNDSPLLSNSTAPSQSKLRPLERQAVLSLSDTKPNLSDDKHYSGPLPDRSAAPSQSKLRPLERQAVLISSNTNLDLPEDKHHSGSPPDRLATPSQSKLRPLERQAALNSGYTNRISMNPRNILGRKENRQSINTDPLKSPHDTLGKKKSDQSMSIEGILNLRSLSNIKVHRQSSPTDSRTYTPDSNFWSPLNASKALKSAIAEIQAKNLGIHGFAKLRQLWPEAPDSIWEDGYQFNELLTSLLENLAYLKDEMKSGYSGAAAQTRQILCVIKLLLKHQSKYFDNFYTQTVCEIIAARDHCQPHELVKVLLDEIASLIADRCEPNNTMPEICGLIEVDKAEANHIMGMNVLSIILHRCHGKDIFVEIPNMRQIGWCARRHIEGPDSAIRRAAVGLIIEMRANVDPWTLWESLPNVTRDQESLIMYYLGRDKEHEF